MKKILLLLICVPVLGIRCDTAQQILTAAGQQGGTGLTTTEIAAGLKEALTVGASRSGNLLSATDGFFKNAAIKILLPEEARKVENTLRDLGMSSLVDKAVLALNRAAEDAAKQAAPIFTSAIREMTIQDAVGILRGGENAATNYLKQKTTASLTAAFRPVIENSLQKVNATKYWSDVFSTYNKFSTNKINPDLSGYVTEKALSGIFLAVADEEAKIRRDPVARSTELLKKVFGSVLATKG